MHATRIRKQFAPLQGANVQKIAVHIDPELLIEYQGTIAPTRIAKSEIAQAMAAEYPYAAKTLSAGHGA
jgi:hypothetical protein